METDAASSGTGRSQSSVRPGMSWGIKRSFTQYIEAMPDGRRGAGHGATEMPDGTFFFELADAANFDPQTRQGILKYQGDVRYKAHQGMLFVMIVDPWLEFNGDSVELSIVDAERWPDTDRRMVLATLEADEAGGALPPGWEQMDALLSQAGVNMFNDVYPLGDPLEPVRFSFMI